MLMVGSVATPFDCRAVIGSSIVELDWRQLHREEFLVLLFDQLDDPQAFSYQYSQFCFARVEFQRLQANAAFVCRNQAYDILSSDRPSAETEHDNVSVPLLVDSDGQIASMYDMTLDSGESLFGHCIIDPFGIVRQFSQSSVPLGVRADEVVRCLKALLQPTADWPC